jgi:hypothetical protein
LFVNPATRTNVFARRRLARWFPPPIRHRLSGILGPVLAGLLLAIGAVETRAAEAPLDASVPLTFLSEDPGLLSEEQALTEFGPVTEGHTTLIWREDPEADGYRLLGEEGRVLYEGRFTQAFISGLPNGEHEFRVVAVDRFGQVISTGPAPVVVTVQHWDVNLAWGLFGLGAVVMASLGAVLWVGTARGVEPPRSATAKLVTEPPVSKPADQNGGEA